MVESHEELEVYRLAFGAAMKIFEPAKEFPRGETCSLTGQIRKASRSVCSNISQGWRKRSYVAALRSELNDAEGGAAETHTWLHFAVACRYLEEEVGQQLHETHDRIMCKLVKMIVDPTPWILPIHNR